VLERFQLDRIILYMYTSEYAHKYRMPNTRAYERYTD